jgi:hypothetical protein
LHQRTRRRRAPIEALQNSPRWGGERYTAHGDGRAPRGLRESDRADKLMAELLKTTSNLMAAKEAQARGLRTLQTRGLVIERAPVVEVLVEPP